MNNKSKSLFYFIISILIAFAAWIFVVYNFCPTKDITFFNLQLNYEGEDTLANRGMAISTASVDTVDVTLRIDRTNIKNINAEDINVSVDVSTSDMGENKNTINVTIPEGATLVKKSKSIVSYNVDECVNKSVDVVAVYSDSLEGSGEPAFNIISTDSVIAYGTQENIDKINYATLRFQHSQLTDEPMHFDIAPVALSDNGEVVSHIVFYPRTLSVYAFNGSVKTVKLNCNINDYSNVEKDYKAPSKITIKGSAPILETIDAIETEPINLSAITEDTEIMLRYKLPSGVNIAQSSMGKTLKVTIR